MSVALIIASAGIGRRFNDKVKKQYYQIRGQSILFWTLSRMLKAYHFDEVVIGIELADKELIKAILSDVACENYTKIVEGGEQRADTVYNCLKKTASEFVAVHDAVRPFFDLQCVNDTVKKAQADGAAICGVYARDTVKSISSWKIEKTLDRSGIFLAHTPQVFNREKLLYAYENFYKKGDTVTDDAEVFEKSHGVISLVNSNSDNMKVTFSSDIEMIEFLAERYF